MIGDGPDLQMEPEKVERHLRRIKSGIPASLVRQLESNEHTLFPADGDPYTAERGLFHPPQISEELAHILQARLDEMEPYMLPAERTWIIARCVTALGHYFTPADFMHRAEGVPPRRARSEQRGDHAAGEAPTRLQDADAHEISRRGVGYEDDPPVGGDQEGRGAGRMAPRIHVWQGA